MKKDNGIKKRSFIKEFFSTEASSGIILGIAALIALIVANSPLSEAYFSFFDFKIGSLSLKYWINDALMAIFFFVVGLEIKRELTLGHLSSPSKAALPIAAAIGGMLIPALIYAFGNREAPASNGWGIPMATDIAFAVGVLVLLGKRIPFALKVFLLAVAIVDDIGAILVIAFFYTNEIRGAGLGIAALAFGISMLMKYAGVRSYILYTLAGTVVWAGFLYSGVHATIAGVLLGLLTPVNFPKQKNSEDAYSPLEELIHVLHPWVSFGILPIFALANAGVSLQGASFIETVSNPISLGIILGLFLGKPIGIFLACFVGVKFLRIKLAEGMRWLDIVGVGFLAGIGFTMSIFISGLALPGELEIYSKSGIIIGSLLSAGVGALLLFLSVSRKPTESGT
jgi:NhaA family Na+:H+ antiporter